MDMDMYHGHGHAAWTLTCSMDMDMQNLCELAVWTWTCLVDMFMQQGHAAWTWTCSMVMDMQHGHGHVARLFHNRQHMCFTRTVEGITSNRGNRGSTELHQVLGRYVPTLRPRTFNSRTIRPRTLYRVFTSPYVSSLKCEDHTQDKVRLGLMPSYVGCDRPYSGLY
jgi:hypothetical protein